jgi:hypothetical protein
MTDLAQIFYLYGLVMCYVCVCCRLGTELTLQACINYILLDVYIDRVENFATRLEIPTECKGVIIPG